MMAGGYATYPSDGMRQLVARLEKLEADNAALRKAVTGLGIQVDPSSNSIVLGGSRAVRVVDTDGHVVAYIGALPASYNRSDGSPQPGILFNREDGTLAALLGDVNPLTPPYKQALQLFDRAGNVVIADDTNSGFGLATPNLSNSAFVDSNYTTWPATNAAAFTTIAYCWYQVQNPHVQWSIDFTGDVGVGGQFRMMASWPGNTHGYGTAQVGATQTQGTTGAFGFFSYYGALPFPLTWDLTDGTAYLYLELQARVTSGTGKMYAVCSQFGGGQS